MTIHIGRFARNTIGIPDQNDSFDGFQSFLAQLAGSLENQTRALGVAEKNIFLIGTSLYTSADGMREVFLTRGSILSWTGGVEDRLTETAGGVLKNARDEGLEHH